MDSGALMDFDPNSAVPDAPAAGGGGFDPSSATPAFHFSDDAVKRAFGRPGANVVMMTPQQYLAFMPEIKGDPRTDKKGKSLQGSLNRGEPVDEVPSMDIVVGKDGHARITDQDGRHRAQAALDAGLGQIPVVVQRYGDKAPVKEITGMRDGATAVPFDFKPATAPAEPKPKPAPPSVLQRLRDAIYVPPEKRDKSLKDAVVGGLTGIPGEIGRQVSEAADTVKGDFLPRSPTEKIVNTAANLLLPGVKPALDIAGLATAPVTGALTSGVGRPYEYETGVDRNVTGNALTMMIPVGGEARIAKVAEDAVKGAGEAEHAARVARLRAEGIEPTAGQARGGIVRRFEEGHRSNPLVGEAIRDQETQALQGFNRAIYNRVLEPIGVKLKPDVPVNRNSVKVVGDMVGRAYDTLKPGMRLVPDDEGLKALADIRNGVTELPPAQQAQFEAILNNRVIERLGQTGEMDGTAFKNVESELGYLARSYKGSPDPAQRGLGHAIEDVMGTLRDNLERTSAPGIRADLQKVNKSWALLTRLEDAASARRGSQGLITPGDLLSAVRRGDKSVRRRAFSRGDALLQDLGEDADAVLSSRVPDSGTPERLMMNNHQGLMMYLAGRLSNPAANAGMNILKRTQPHVPTPQNSLLHPQLLRPLPAAGSITNLLQTNPAMLSGPNGQ